VLDAFEVVTVARIGELVEDDDVVAGGDEPLDEVASDEPATACYEDAHAADPRRKRP
jgi:hypothetical protein